MTLQALMPPIIVVINVCRKLHWLRPDIFDFVLGVFSSPVRFVIISTARCSSSRNSLRGITHSIHPSPSPHFGGGATSSFDGIFLEYFVC